MRTWVLAHVSCMPTCMSDVCMYTYMHRACTHACMYVHVHTHFNVQAHTETHVRAQTRAHTHRHTDTNTHTYTCRLPLAHVIGGKVLVVHGGLFSKEETCLDDLRKISRHRVFSKVLFIVTFV
jgi:hypothetical protein